MSRRHGPAVAALAAAALALAACGRPTGDLGRAAPSVLHDTILPEAGLALAAAREEPVSPFNWTDAERRLRDRAYAFVRPPHARDWLGAALVEGQRTRILPEVDQHLDPANYYALLRRDPYRSSEARYARIATDMAADAALVGPFCAEARFVRDGDAYRLAALQARGPLAADEIAAAEARIDENGRVVDWVWRALGFRLTAYRIAIERIGVETPSPRHQALAAGWAALHHAIVKAGCGTPLPYRPIAVLVRPSRYTRVVTEEVVLPK